MIVCWSWLKEYVDLDMSVEALVDRLMMAGLNHESTREVGGDIAIDLEVTSNRPDCLGHMGIAREISVLYGRSLRLPKSDFSESDRQTDQRTSVNVARGADAWCPQYRARLIEGVTIGPSPKWLARRLETLGLASINNVVDVTNYVLMECGQPLHAFDFDALSEKRIVVRPAHAGEKFVAINNKTYELKEGMGVIADAAQAVAIAGVMGGKATEVGPSTKNILLESAEFDALSIRRTSRALDLSSDSSYRFERKIDPAGVAWASDRACHLIQELAGGSVAKGALHVGRPVPPAPSIPLRWDRVRRVLGMDVSPAACRRILESLGLSVLAEGGGAIEVRPPSFRRDLLREIDLIEEIGRIHGYAEVSQDRAIPLTVAPITRDRRVWSKIRDVLIAAGFQEAVTFTFTDAKTAARVRPWTSAEPIALQHSSRKHENRLRQSLIPSLLDAVRLNESRGNEAVRLFETAAIFLPKGATDLPDEPRVLGLAAMTDLRQLRGVLDAIFSRLKLSPRFHPADIPGFERGKAAEYLLSSERIAVLGVIADEVKASLDLRANVVAAEIQLGVLIENANLGVTVESIPDQPAVVRDLAVVLDEAVRWATLEEAVLASAGPLLRNLSFVDLYRGKQVDAGKKSIAFRMTFRASDRTLTKEEVDAFVQSVVERLSKDLGGKLRA